MKPVQFERKREDVGLESFVIDWLLEGDRPDEGFGVHFSRFTTSVLLDIAGVPSTFDGCVIDKIASDEKSVHVSGEVFWLGPSVADYFKFDVDRARSDLYSWKFYKGFDPRDQVLYVARLSDCWRYSFTFN